MASICRRLDGLPLAIELAAARVTVLTPAEINAGLEDRFRLLRGRDRTVPERQRTLEALLDWSYALLSDDERTALNRLGIFSASFDTEKELTLKGTVTEWLWANPHCFLKINAKDDTGTVRNWNLELGNPTDMTPRGYGRRTFKVGDEVTVVLQPVKSGASVGRIRSVILPNGQKL